MHRLLAVAPLVCCVVWSSWPTAAAASSDGHGSGKLEPGIVACDGGGAPGGRGLHLGAARDAVAGADDAGERQPLKTRRESGGGASTGAPCCTNADCDAPTPICSLAGACTSTRIVEPTSWLPPAWDTAFDHSVWTKFVRAAVPVVGKATTQDAALFEAAYFIDNALYPEIGDGGARKWDGLAGLQESMLKDRPTIISVWPVSDQSSRLACLPRSARWCVRAHSVWSLV